ncbi:MAG: ABC transporter permease [Dysgonamonadaceae bacterium]|jgi:ABC-2 type transport system permease protein|nr:ABC transporter permease [Dysgonamonadaceae bacterium]HUI33583.1 ABC transporter permease [Dysgonamonadaceae bacterium]
MDALKIIISREYISRVTKKSFILLTILMPFLFTALIFVPYWLSTIQDSEERKIVVIDNSGFYAPEFKSTENYTFEIVGDANISDQQSRLGKDLYAILQITDDLSKDPKAVTFLSEKQAPLDLLSSIERTLSEKVSEQKLEALSHSDNVDSKTIDQVKQIIESGSRISLSTMKWGKGGSISETSTVVASIVGGVFTVLIYMFIMIYGAMVMQAVMEEKRSRIVEVMISSVKPVYMLIGKIVGIGLVGITQLVFWGIMIGILFIGATAFFTNPEQAGQMAAAGGSMATEGFDIEGALASIMTVNWFEIIFFFLIYFIGGFIMFASIFATIGSAVDNEEDTQQFMTPITLLMLFAFYAGFYSINNPDGPLAFWGSLIPITSPIVMMVRLPFGVPLWEKLLSVVLLYGSFILTSIMAAKIYRVGILMYGKKPSIKEIIKWMKYK